MLSLNVLLRSLAAFALVAGAGFARAADMPAAAAAPAGCAVDGVNGKVAALGGASAGNSLYGGLASVSLPIGCGFGAQFDASAGSYNNSFLGSLAGHVFWRDPARALAGVYGSYNFWNQFGGLNSNHLGPEAEVYFGRWTLQGVGGVEWGNSVSGVNGLNIQTFTVATRFFDQINLGYYIEDNFKLYVGHRYLGGRNAAALGGEYGIPLGNGMMASLFAEGRVGERNFNGVWGGVRVYFGQKDKTLIRRHREDDPIIWSDGPNGTNATSSSQAQAQQQQQNPNIPNIPNNPQIPCGVGFLPGFQPNCTLVGPVT